MNIYENEKIRVSLTEGQAAKFNYCRAEILSRAMQILGNRSELDAMQAETISQEEIRKLAHDIMVFEYLEKNSIYDIIELWYRYKSGARLSDNKIREIELAEDYAVNNIEQGIELARQFSDENKILEIKYRNNIANSDWNIEVKNADLMPEQIGVCRYK